MTAFIVEGELHGILARRNMDKRIAAMKDHFIVCGTGDVGHYVFEEFAAMQRGFVAVDADEEQFKKLSGERASPMWRAMRRRRRCWPRPASPRRLA